MEKLVKCVLRKKILNSGLIAAFIVFAGIQSVEAQSINNNPNTFEKPASDLSKKKLNLVDLKAFEDRAVQKVDESVHLRRFILEARGKPFLST
jgi:hypothetical protein